MIKLDRKDFLTLKDFTKQEIEDSPAVDMSQPISEVALSKAESRFTAVH